ncbi:MAG: PDZ domain-containing protein [Verrucomicrobiota bacterium]
MTFKALIMCLCLLSASSLAAQPPEFKTICITQSAYKDLLSWLEEYAGKKGANFPLSLSNDDIQYYAFEEPIADTNINSMLRIHLNVLAPQSVKSGFIDIYIEPELKDAPYKDAQIDWPTFFRKHIIKGHEVSKLVTVELTPEEIQESLAYILNASHLGVKICYTTSEATYPSITSVVASGPAKLAGLRIGDTITHLDGISIEDMEHSLVFSHISGIPGTTLELTIQRAEENKPLTIRIKREARD